jgi:hypothetical protein
VSASEAVDLHENSKNFLTEAEVDRFLQAAKCGCHGMRDHLVLERRIIPFPRRGESAEDGRHDL